MYMYVYSRGLGDPRDVGRGADTVSFHNFKSQKFKLSLSNPKSKHVAYLSVLSRISNCQVPGRKNEHEISKTDRSDADDDTPSPPTKSFPTKSP